MSHSPITPEERFATIVEALLSNPDVTPPSDAPQSKKGFGSSGLRINNKIFAMLVKDKLVVKLPKSRVDALIASGKGERFDPRHDGRLMKEWVSVAPASEEEWLDLAREAMEFVASQR
jgi:TfoX/Sxy family transcriptional regulator of competence genes